MGFLPGAMVTDNISGIDEVPATPYGLSGEDKVHPNGHLYSYHFQGDISNPVESPPIFCSDFISRKFAKTDFR
jgi:hypothetical protein